MNANQYRTTGQRRPVRQAQGRPGRRRVLQVGVGLVAGSAAAFLIACGGDDAKEEAAVTTAPGGATAPQGAEAPKQGGRLGEFVGSNTNNLNVVSDAIQGAYIGGLRVYDRLISQRPGKDTAREYVPEAAQSVEQPDPATVIFKLKPGLTFHDRAPVSGRAVTAEDVVKSQFYVRDNPRSSIKYFQTEAMQNGEAPDAETVVFTLKAPAAYLFSGTELSHVQGSCIVPTEMHDSLDTAWQIGSGPYELAEYEVNVRYRYKRFEGFREAARGMPYVAEKELRVVIDSAAQEAAFRSEQAHIWGYPQVGPPFPNIADQLKKDLGNRIELDEYLNPAMITLVANVNRPPWNDVRVREALYRYLDRQRMVDLLEAGRGKVTPGPLSIPLEEYQLDPTQTEKYYRQDPRAARQLLEAAGFPFDREVELAIAPSARNQQGAEIIQELASRAGVKVRILSLPFPEWVDRGRRQDSWEWWFSGHPPYDTPLDLLRFQHSQTKHGLQYTGLRDPQTDKMIEQSEQTLDRAERVKLVKEIQIALLEKYTPFIITHNAPAFLARWKSVRDYEHNPFFQPMNQAQMWLDE